jgi:hypothetical protein
LKHSIIIGISGFITTILIGYICQGAVLFLPGSLAYQIFIFALFGAVAYPIFSIFKLKWSLIIFLVFLIIVSFYEVYLGDHPTYTSIIFYFSYGSFLYVYCLFIRNEQVKKPIFRILLLAFCYAAANLIFVLLNSLFVKSGNPFTMIFLQMIIGFVLGLCLGCGFELGRVINKKLSRE